MNSDQQFAAVSTSFSFEVVDAAKQVSLTYSDISAIVLAAEPSALSSTKIPTVVVDLINTGGIVLSLFTVGVNVGRLEIGALVGGGDGAVDGDDDTGDPVGALVLSGIGAAVGVDDTLGSSMIIANVGNADDGDGDGAGVRSPVVVMDTVVVVPVLVVVVVMVLDVVVRSSTGTATPQSSPDSNVKEGPDSSHQLILLATFALAV